MSDKENVLILDRISDFNSVISFYEETAELITKLRPNITMTELKDEFESLSQYEKIVFAARAMVVSESLKLFNIEEILSKYRIGNVELERMFEGIDFLDKFQLKNSNDKKQKIRQLRNCLAHAMYEIKIVNYSKIYIHTNNGYISGDIEINEFIELIKSYENVFDKFIEKKLEKLGVLYFDEKKLDEKTEKLSINKFVNSITISGKKISPEREKEIKKWLKNIGINNLRISGKDTKTKQKQKSQLVLTTAFLINATAKNEDDIKVAVSSDVNYMIQLYSMIIASPEYWRAGDEQAMEEENISIKELYDLSISQLAAQKPFLYAKSAIALANYCFVYIREINKNRNRPIFEYNGIDLSGVTIKYLSKEESIKRTINLREKLERAPKRKKDQIQKQIDRYGDVMVNSSNLFRHLRDSIAHNNYNIDYSKYINTRKLDDIIITFRTYEKYTDELDFEVEISVKEIKRLVKELQNSINLSIELSDEGKNSEVSFLREALVFRNLGLEDIEKESISMKEEER